MLLGLDKFGDTDWYAAGSAGLIKQQQENGSWQSAHADPDPEGLSDTAFACCFSAKPTWAATSPACSKGRRTRSS